MEYRFVRDFTPEDGHTGKLLLYLSGDEIHLNGVQTPKFGGITEAHAENPGKAFDHLLSLKEDLSAELGYHNKIPHTGTPLGGCVFGRDGSRLYIAGRSSFFGPIHPEAVQGCVDDLGIEVVDSGRFLRPCTLEEYFKEQLPRSEWERLNGGAE